MLCAGPRRPQRHALAHQEIDEGPGQPPLAVAAFLLGGREDGGERQAPDRRSRGGKTRFAHEKIPLFSGELVAAVGGDGPECRRRMDSISIWLPLHMKKGAADCQTYPHFFFTGGRAMDFPVALDRQVIVENP